MGSLKQLPVGFVLQNAQLWCLTESPLGVAGSAVTIITSAGGKAVTVGASGATSVAGDITSFYQSATAAVQYVKATHLDASS